MDKWVPPIAGKMLNLPLRGIVIQTQLPVKADIMKCEPNGTVGASMIEKMANTVNHICLSFIIINPLNRQVDEKNQMTNSLTCFLPSAHNQDCFTAFAPVINQLQLLWELILTNQVWICQFSIFPMELCLS